MSWSRSLSRSQKRVIKPKLRMVKLRFSQQYDCGSYSLMRRLLAVRKRYLIGLKPFLPKMLWLFYYVDSFTRVRLNWATQVIQLSQSVLRFVFFWKGKNIVRTCVRQACWWWWCWTPGLFRIRTRQRTPADWDGMRYSMESHWAPRNHTSKMGVTLILFTVNNHIVTDSHHKLSPHISLSTNCNFNKSIQSHSLSL